MDTDNSYKVLVVDGITGDTFERSFTDQEIADFEQLKERSINEQAQREAEAQAKADARASALAKLADLGLTQDEINAL